MPFSKQKFENNNAKKNRQSSSENRRLFGGGGRIRFAVASPQRWRVSTGHSPRAAFQIRPSIQKIQHQKALDFFGVFKLNVYFLPFLESWKIGIFPRAATTFHILTGPGYSCAQDGVLELVCPQSKFYQNPQKRIFPNFGREM